MKKSSKIQIKAIMRYHFTPIRLANIKKSGNTKRWQGRQAMRNLIPDGGSVN